jgi:hypothetical protein
MGKLKIDKENLAKMQEDIEAVLPYYLKANNTSLTNLVEWQIRDIWFHVYVNLTYPDNAPFMKWIINDNGGRLLQINRERYDDNMYPCGTNDDTLYSALKHIIKIIKEKQNG